MFQFHPVRLKALVNCFAFCPYAVSIPSGAVKSAFDVPAFAGMAVFQFHPVRLKEVSLDTI